MCETCSLPCTPRKGEWFSLSPHRSLVVEWEVKREMGVTI